MEVVPNTPSPGPSSTVHTPPAPLHGYADNWEPYTPRKSARLSQRATNRTPSPRMPSRHLPEQRRNLNSERTPKSSKLRATSMTSPTSSPQKPHARPMDPSRASGFLTVESAAAALGLPPHAEQQQPGRASMSAAGGMLITPAKTPQKPSTQQTRDKIQAVARNLFDESEVMPSPKKARTQQYVLDSFSANDTEDPIEIYTDSHERVPEVDQRSENPFFGSHPAETSRAPRRSKRHIVSIPGEGKVSVDDAVRREDGMVIVFRGKKQFRKFASNDPSTSDSEVAQSRAAVKPRLLFPPKAEAPRVETDDEEAATDIEDHNLVVETENDPVTPADLKEDIPDIPEAPKFTRGTPPTTARTTRYGTRKAAEASPIKSKELEVPKAARSKRSPFDGWRRTKGGSSGSVPQKRSGEALPTSPAKRARA